MIFSLEFLRHFDTCNRAEFGHKRQFYALKTQILKRYGRRIRYDLQTFEKLWCYQCGCAVSNLCSDQNCGGEHISLHKHILEVYVLEFEDESSRIWHVPTGEFSYRNYANSNYDKKSAGYDALSLRISERTGLKSPDKTIEPGSARQSFEWLSEWAQQHLYRPTLTLEIRPYHIPPEGKRRHYNRVRSDGRVIFGLELNSKTQQWSFRRRWQTIKGMRYGPALPWPPHVRRPHEGMYSLEEKCWKILVTLANDVKEKNTDTPAGQGKAKQNTLPDAQRSDFRGNVLG